MLFNSPEFFVFLVVVLGTYYCLTTRAQNVWLLAASYLFYGLWDWRFLGLILGSTLIDYGVGLALARQPDGRRRDLMMGVSLAVNLGILGFFKYFNFFAGSLKELLESLGIHVGFTTLEIVLPVGVSFYTFQALSYTIDVYRRKLEASRDLLTFALFIAYFPQLVAGPIERATDLLPRLVAPRSVRWPAFGVGLELMFIGYLKKVGVADTLAPLVEARFARPDLASGQELLIAAYLFAFQIYGDFAGYSDIARGVSKLFGVDLVRNFEQPYLARNITDFWRRWHISLSTWLRDYLYVSLGGNRHGRWKTYRNLLLTMVLGGLWHGASWTFVFWGTLHGVYLAIHKAWREWGPAVRPAPPAGRRVLRTVLGTFLTFHLVTLTWVFFRTGSLRHAWDYLAGIASWQRSTGAFAELSWQAPMLWLLILAVVVIDVSQARSGDHAFMLRWRWPVRGIAYAVVVGITLVFGNLDGKTPFIYFQF